MTTTTIQAVSFNPAKYRHLLLFASLRTIPGNELLGFSLDWEEEQWTIYHDGLLTIDPHAEYIVSLQFFKNGATAAVVRALRPQATTA